MKTKTRTSVVSVQLNNEQLKAVHAPTNRPVVVLAGPGSGKTAVLAARYAYLVDEGEYDPSKIVAVTFTTKMANELLGRILQVCPQADEDNICTIHAFALRTLKNIGVVKAHDQKAKDLSIRIVIDQYLQANLQWRKSPGAVRWWIERAKHEGVPQTEYDLVRYFGGRLVELGATKKDADHLAACALEVRAKLEQDGTWTYSDLVNKLWQSLQDSVTLKLLQKDIDYILVDEGQDTFKLAIQILRKLSPNKFFIVGDPDQTLFRFTGASPEHNLFAVAKTDSLFKLNTNYRSGRTIVDSANHLIEANYANADRKIFAKSMVADNDFSGALHYGQFETPSDEAEWVADDIKRGYDDNDRSPGHVFVGARTNAQLVYVEKALVDNGVPYVVLGTQGFFTQGHIRKIINYIRLVQDETNSGAFEDVYDVASQYMRSWGGNYTPTRYLGKVFLSETGPDYMRILRTGSYAKRFRNGVEDLLGTIDRLQSVVKRSQVSEVVDNVIQLYVMHHKARVGLVSVDAGQDDNVLDDLESLKSIARQYKTLGSFMKFVEETEVSERNKDESGAVVLATVHKLKGLERDVVYGIGWNEGLLPHYKSLGSPTDPPTNDDLPVPSTGSVEDERCVAFVLVTRAKQQVNISSVAEYNGRKMEPSRFVRELFGPREV